MAGITDAFLRGGGSKGPTALKEKEIRLHAMPEGPVHARKKTLKGAYQGRPIENVPRGVGGVTGQEGKRPPH